MARGYMGKILNVNLTTGKLQEEALSEELCRDFVGGYGIAARLLYERIPVGADPLGPDNVLGFMTGPLTGTPALIGSRYVMVGKSALHGGWGDCNSGGDFGPNLKFAGFDGVFFSGISPKPVYLFIENGKAELRDASDLWGKDTNEVDDILKARHGKETVASCIGPAGEKLVLFACAINDKGRAPGRSGLGAVMGAKKLKAVAVKGNLPVPMFDEKKAQELRRKYLRESKGFFDTLHTYGTCGITADSAMSGDSPVKNWAGVGPRDFPTASAISDEVVKFYEEKKYGCWRCPIACGGIMKLDSGPFALSARENFRGHKPEYETLCMFGTLTLDDDVQSIIKINEICNMYGMDTISAGAVAAFAIECYENGLLTKRDTGGLELTWGNAQAIVALTEKVAKREGIGDILAEGVMRAAKEIGKGAEEFAIHVSGQEVPAHDPKFTPGLALTYMLDATPGRHTQGGELVQPPGWFTAYDKYAYDQNSEMFYKLRTTTHVMNAAGLCMFGYISYDIQSMPDFLGAITGWHGTLEEIYKTGERIDVMRHAFNLREGINPLTRNMPGRIVGEPPLTEGNVRNVTVDYRTEVKKYLELMDWNKATTIPSEAKLKELGLGFLAKDLAKVKVPASNLLA